MKEISFLNPDFFWLFLLIPFFIFWNFYSRNKQNATLKTPFTEIFSKKTGIKAKLYPILFILRLFSFIFLVIALARPQSSKHISKTKKTEGIDIVLSVDISGSMYAKDLKPNRLEALKEVASSFIKDRKNDRIGLVVYSGESYTRVPVTSDKQIVLKSLKEISYGQIQDGTAIGLGLGTAVNRLKDSKAKSKVIILMTDGVNNQGFIEPKTASELAQNYNIKVYTMGIGTNGMALSPVSINPDGSFQYAMQEVEIDENLLKEIAQTTGGKYFRATSNKKLEEIYKEIDKLEKTEIDEIKFYQFQEKFRIWAIWALVFLGLEFLLKHTYFKKGV